MTAARAESERPISLLIGLATLAAVTVGIALVKGVSDPDTFWHLTTGRLILESGVPTTDPFSYTWQGQPWTDHEWLGQVILAVKFDAVGVAATVAALALWVVLGLGALAWALARAGASTGPTVAASALAVAALIPWLTIRPQVISWGMLGFLLAGLLSFGADHPRRALWLIPFFALWANLHGLWVVGLGVVAVWLVATLLRATPMADARGWAAIGAAGALLATALTPAGPAGILYPLRYVDAGDWGLANIAEWQSPNFHEPANLLFLVLLGAVLLLGLRGMPRWLAAVAVLGIVGGLISQRNVPVAAVLAMPAVASPLSVLMIRTLSTTPRPSRAARARQLMEGVAGLIVAGAALAILVPLTKVDLEKLSPVAGADRLVQADPDARVFTEYGWGGYLISRLHPTGGLVYVDGRNDMYTDDILRTWEATRDAEPGWEETLAESGTTAILLRPDAPLVSAAGETDAWCIAHDDERQVLLLPAGSDACP